MSIKRPEGLSWRHQQPVPAPDSEQACDPTTKPLPEAGFATLIGQWVHCHLCSWGYDLLDPMLVQWGGYLRLLTIQRVWRQEPSARFDHTSRLWEVLIWQALLEDRG
jgi:hypothetical protein